ncbi:helix-turn-helix domain-containing protein [Xanthomonas theicola]|uniref:Transcriptional regulator n=1 Tax=Xanthomonas theicola TaxID=56464 RepID=A0A2S6ZMC6_9XANT|nr:helix-turn-helix transcriptional regulator [Xanthomonas theicola]PPT93329.1 transcriptional regulator [Xanthomonas theicola]QNH25516.1 helix-turn-helix transcriptional regulator [Xanthomonas theicola]
MKSFGDRLREARKAAGLTQEQLGFALGVTKSSVSAWENDRETPGFRLLPNLRGVLKRSLDELICGQVQGAARVHDASADYVLQAHDAHEKALLTRYRNLPARRREAVLELLKPDKG